MRRISLATLLLLMLSLAASAVVYRNWEPWALIHTNESTGFFLESHSVLVFTQAKSERAQMYLLDCDSKNVVTSFALPDGPGVHISSVNEVSPKFFAFSGSFGTEPTRVHFQQIASYPDGKQVLPSSPRPTQVEWSKDGSVWLVRYAAGKTEIWDGSQGTLRHELKVREYGPQVNWRKNINPETELMVSMAVSPDGKRAVVNGDLFDTQSGVRIAELREPGVYYAKICFSDDSRWLSLCFTNVVTAGGENPSEEADHWIFDANSGARIAGKERISLECNPFIRPNRAMSFAKPSEQKPGGETRLLNLENNEWLPQRFEGEFYYGFPGELDGHRILTQRVVEHPTIGGSGEESYVEWIAWDTRDFSRISSARLPWQLPVDRNVIGSDGDTVALGTILWDLRTGDLHPLLPIKNYAWVHFRNGRVVSGNEIFSVNGQHLYTLARDIASANDGQRVGAFSKDGRYILLLHKGGTLVYEQRRNEGMVWRFLSLEFAALALFAILFFWSFTRDFKGIQKVSVSETSA